MSLSPQTQRRLVLIKPMLLKGKSYETIGKACGVTERTIDRDVSAWYKSGKYEAWLFQEWLRLHAEVLKEDRVEPYRQVSKLISRMVTRKAEIRTEINAHVEVVKHIDGLNSDEQELLNQVTRKYIKAEHKAEPASIH